MTDANDVAVAVVIVGAEPRLAVWATSARFDNHSGANDAEARFVQPHIIGSRNLKARAGRAAAARIDKACACICGTRERRRKHNDRDRGQQKQPANNDGVAKAADHDQGHRDTTSEESGSHI